MPDISQVLELVCALNYTSTLNKDNPFYEQAHRPGVFAIKQNIGF